MAAKFKVGDRVLVIKDGDRSTGGSGHTTPIGDVVVPGKRCHNFWRTSGDDFYDHEIELVTEPAPLTIVAGRYYKTRDGRKVGPMQGGGFSGWLDAGRKYTGYGWSDDGSYIKGTVCQLDLIAEWPTDAPTRRGNPAAQVDAIADEYGGAKPKFKVGDRVKCIKNSDGRGFGLCGTVADVGGWGVGVEMDAPFGGHGGSGNHWNFYYPDDQLTAIDAPAAPRVEAPAKPKFKVGDRVRVVRHCNSSGDPIRMGVAVGDVRNIVKITHQIEGVDCCILDGDNMHFYAHHNLEIVAQSTPAIVALIENGQPKPATEPFVHADRDAAETEARRLAGKHPGKEFGVYEFVSSAHVEPKHEWQRLAAKGDKDGAVARLVADSGIERIHARNAVDRFVA